MTSNYDPFGLDEVKRVDVEILPSEPAPLYRRIPTVPAPAIDAIEWVKDNAIAVTLGILSIPVFIANLPYLQSQIADWGQQREIVSSAAKAEARYREGLQFLVWSDKPDYAATLREGEPVLDGATAGMYPRYLPEGITVGTMKGITAILVDDDGLPQTPAVASDLAITGNREVIKDAATKAGFTAIDLNLQVGE